MRTEQFRIRCYTEWDAKTFRNYSKETLEYFIKKLKIIHKIKIVFKVLIIAMASIATTVIAICWFYGER